MLNNFLEIEDNIEIKIGEKIKCVTAIKPQPMLKLKSFAKQPDFWNNSQDTTDKKPGPKKTVNNKEPILIDLDEDDNDNSIQVLSPQVPTTARLKNSKGELKFYILLTQTCFKHFIIFFFIIFFF